MRLSLPILALLLLAGCATTSAPPVAWHTVNLPNGCSLNARGYQAAYDAVASQRPWFWSRVLVIKLSNDPQVSPNSHAICAVQWEQEIWGYDDTSGSHKLTTDLKAKDDAEYLAEMWLPRSQDYVTAYFHERAP